MKTILESAAKIACTQMRVQSFAAAKDADHGIGAEERRQLAVVRQ